LNELKKYWKDLAPENNVDKLEGKKISILLSEADTVIPYRFGMNLVKSLEQHNVPLKLETNKHLGHYLTVYNLLSHPSKFV
jgi:predicted esterase